MTSTPGHRRLAESADGNHAAAAYEFRDMAAKDAVTCVRQANTILKPTRGKALSAYHEGVWWLNLAEPGRAEGQS